MTQSIGLLNAKSVYNIIITKQIKQFIFILFGETHHQPGPPSDFVPTSKTILPICIPAMNLYHILCYVSLVEYIYIYHIRTMYILSMCFFMTSVVETGFYSRLIQIFIARLIILFIYNCEMLTRIYLYITLNYIYILQVYIVQYKKAHTIHII